MWTPCKTTARGDVKWHQGENHLTISGLHQLCIAVLWRLFVGGGASALISVCLDAVAAAAGAVGVACDVWWGRVVLCVWGRTLVSSSLTQGTVGWDRTEVWNVLKCYATDVSWDSDGTLDQQL